MNNKRFLRNDSSSGEIKEEPALNISDSEEVTKKVKLEYYEEDAFEISVYGSEDGSGELDYQCAGDNSETIPNNINNDESRSFENSQAEASTSSNIHLLQIKGANQLLFEKFYVILEKTCKSEFSKKMGGIVAQCRMCCAKIKGTLAVSSNFIAHLRKRHLKEYKEYELEKRANKQETKKTVTRETRILAYLASTGAPLNTVKNPKFIEMFSGLGFKMKDKHKMVELLKEICKDSKQNIRLSLSNVEFCCTTLDIWSINRRRFFGYTCHWIDENLERKSVALACRQIRGSFSQDKMLHFIDTIHKKYELDNEKVLLIITNNGADFTKHFREYGFTVQTAPDSESEAEDEIDENQADGNDDLMNTTGGEEFEFLSIDLNLPKQFRSVHYTLSLVYTTDFLNIIKQNDNIYQHHTHCFQRCTSLWNICSHPKTAYIIKKVLSQSLITPTASRWTSLYDSLKDLLKYKLKLSALCAALNITNFIPSDIEYMEDYISLMTPFAEAIEFMQGEKKMYFGYYFATIVSLKVKLEKMKTSKDLKLLSFAAKDLMYCLSERFKYLFTVSAEAENAVVAAVACPSIKLKFVSALKSTAPKSSFETFKEIFVRHAAQFCEKSTQQELTQDSDDDFLDFGSENSNKHDARRELELYLVDSDTTFSCLLRYPLIKKMFIKYNTPLPSSAPVEHLLSFPEILNSFEKDRTPNCNFERLALMKANNL